MTKTKKVVYWVATLWLSLGMVSSGIVQLLGIPEETEFIINLGYPAYMLALLAVWKLLGVVAVLVPRFPLIKEWAYAGFFFAMTGAAYSHIVVGTLDEIFGSLLLLTLTVVSWYFRPESRRLVSLTKKTANESEGRLVL